MTDTSKEYEELYHDNMQLKSQVYNLKQENDLLREEVDDLKDEWLEVKTQSFDLKRTAQKWNRLTQPIQYPIQIGNSEYRAENTPWPSVRINRYDADGCYAGTVHEIEYDHPEELEQWVIPAVDRFIRGLMIEHMMSEPRDGA